MVVRIIVTPGKHDSQLSELCAREAKSQATICPIRRPSCPWKIADYYSRYSEICPLSCLTDAAVIDGLKEIFVCFGIPEIVRSDSGSQLVSSNFQSFANTYNFQVITSSQHFLQSNGCVEAAVKIAKNLLKNNDVSLALLTYCMKPLDCGFSPAEMLMNRRLKSTLPLLPAALEEVKFLQRAAHYDRRHRVCQLSDLQQGDKVWVTDLRVYGTIAQNGPQPRSYVVDTHKSKYRRN
ncbi:hypothetical protein PR048_011874 [Dryococelus australis]|uniref:Integrase catalytic domain-containing protein n=1 Tax=Dryococelus australis TaxID=614101 RepID=A0ABQ9HMR3_9NEOP|nr:hypothetical protein PR048_011874 [Dryococelus australis]